MTQQRPTTSRSRTAIARLAAPPRIEALGPHAARFVYSLRLIALHDRARRDPVAELAVRLGSVETAGQALGLARAISATWPEDVCLTRFCCPLLSHDEATIGAALDAAAACDRAGFDAQFAGLIRPDRVERLWDHAVRFVGADRAAG